MNKKGAMKHRMPLLEESLLLTKVYNLVVTSQLGLLGKENDMILKF